MTKKVAEPFTHRVLATFLPLIHLRSQKDTSFLQEEFPMLC